MGELLRRALEGVDPDAPDAAWQMFRNLMGLVPWGLLTALTVLWVVVAWAIAWRRGGRLWTATLWALLLGPLAWPLVWAQSTRTRGCPRCGARIPMTSERCPRCGMQQPPGQNAANA